MKLTPFFTVLFAAVLPCLAQSGPVEVTYDNIYDNPNWPLSETACSNGVNGLENKYATLGAIPKFPFVGGIPGLVWNSTLCGTCWQLTYTAPDATTNSVTAFAVDEAYTFNIAEEAFTALVGGNDGTGNPVSATAVQVSC